MNQTTTQRTHQGSVHGELETPMGRFAYALTSGNHVSLSNGTGDLLYRGDRYSVHIHLYLDQPGQPGKWTDKPGDRPYVTRCSNIQDGTRTAVEKFFSAARDAWEKHISARPDLLRQAQRQALNDRILSAEHDAAEARKQADAAADTLAQLLREESAL